MRYPENRALPPSGLGNARGESNANGIQWEGVATHRDCPHKGSSRRKQGKKYPPLSSPFLFPSSTSHWPNPAGRQGTGNLDDADSSGQPPGEQNKAGQGLEQIWGGCGVGANTQSKQDL